MTAVEPVLGRQELSGYLMADADEAIAALTQRRRRSGVQQWRIAVDAGLQQSAVSLYERGLQRPSVHAFFDWARAQGLRVALIPEDGDE